ncbi:MAG: carbohydrate kinase family protein [Planctomycetes bacterium]|nr:carbohydrate kinase family protein [Planctomycetota bacterium]
MNAHPEVLCCGIVVADHVCTPIARLPEAGELVMADSMLLSSGGCAANAAVDLAKMGVRAAVVGRVGDDMFGGVIADMLKHGDVDVSSLKVTPGADTSQTLIVNVVGQDRRFIHTFGANGQFQAADIPLDRLDHCKILYLGGYLVMPKILQEELVPIFARARQKGVATLLDVVTPGPGDYLPLLDRLLPHVDVFLPNNHEAELICGEKDPLRQAEFFLRLGAKTAVITMGAEGAVLASEHTRLRAAAYPVDFVDGSGGGDAFDAGFIYGLLGKQGPAACLRVASALGASCVRTIGTTPGVFTRSECEAYMAQNPLRVEEIQ